MDKFYDYCKYGQINKANVLNLGIDDVRSRDNFALQFASENGHLEVVKYLKKMFHLN